MFKIFLMLFVAITLLNCQQNDSKQIQKLDVQSFENKIISTPNAQIIDVRTKDEYLSGHIINAKNIDINNSNFNNLVSQLDKSKPVFVYCLSGGRSSYASSILSKAGFKEIFELEDGLIKWTNSNKPTEVGEIKLKQGMSKNEFLQKINSDKLVLVDFNAKWCAPCKEMKPILNEIEKENNIVLLKIDVDENPELAKEMKLEGLPTLILYKNNNIIWSKLGFTEKEEIEKALSL